MAVTAVALAMAAGMAVVVVKLLAEERARSEARVNALARMAAYPLGDSSAPRNVVASVRHTAAAPPASQLPQAAPPMPLDDLEIRSASGVVHRGADLFADAEQPSPWGRRVAVIASLAVIAVGIGWVAVSGRTRQTPSAPSPSSHVQNLEPGDAMPLELLALRHAQETERLVITGLIQNPRSAAPLSHVVATAFLFGPDGTFITSSRAPLDLTTLTPGVESPFVVSVPVTGQVARYRVGFRTEDGRVIAHIDKRGPDALARTQAPDRGIGR